MEIWFGIFAGIMAAVFAVLFLKIRILQKAAREIEHGFAEKLKVDTNTLMELSCNDRHMRSLAEAINIQLRELQKQRHQFRQGDLEKCRFEYFPRFAYSADSRLRLLGFAGRGRNAKDGKTVSCGD